MRHPFSLPLLALSLAAFAAPACLAAPDSVTASPCPVDLTAAQHPGSVLLPADQIHSDDPAVLKPGMAAEQRTLDFSLKNNRLQRIVAVDLAVHGTLHKSGLQRLSSSSAATLEPQRFGEPSAHDIVRTIHLSSSIPAGEERTTFLGVHHLTTVSSVDVVALRYADGTTWTAGPGRSCIATVSPLMLIAGK
jgi:hypothetical protein